MSDDSGSYDVRKMRGGRLPVTWAVIISCAGVLITWGVNAQRLDTSENRLDRLEVLAQIHDREIVETKAATSSQNVDIIRRLARIELKLDQDVPRDERRHR